MKRIYTFPPEPPPALADLYSATADLLAPVEVVPVPSLSDLPTATDAPTADAAVVAVIGGLSPGQPDWNVVDELAALADGPLMDVALVVSDGVLGTDATELRPSLESAAAIAAMRSMAVNRDRRRRANVVCIPGSMFDVVDSQSGVLPQTTEIVDVAEAIAYLLGERGGYVSGQTLFVDGGRHLFSSMSS